MINRYSEQSIRFDRSLRLSREEMINCTTSTRELIAQKARDHRFFKSGFWMHDVEATRTICANFIRTLCRKVSNYDPPTKTIVAFDIDLNMVEPSSERYWNELSERHRMALTMYCIFGGA